MNVETDSYEKRKNKSINFYDCDYVSRALHVLSISVDNMSALEMKQKSTPPM